MTNMHEDADGVNENLSENAENTASSSKIIHDLAGNAKLNLMRAAALMHAEHGFEVFPCKPDTKGPQSFASLPNGKNGKSGVKMASADFETVNHFWHCFPTSLIGWRIPPGFVMVDVDDKVKPDGEIKQGWKHLAEAEELVGCKLPETPFRAISGGRGSERPGEHRLYRLPAGYDGGIPGNLCGRSDWDVDFLHHDHRYSILPPSIHPESRERYEWPDGFFPYRPLAELLAEVPEIPVAFLRRQTATGGAGAGAGSGRSGGAGGRAGADHDGRDAPDEPDVEGVRDALRFIDPDAKYGVWGEEVLPGIHHYFRGGKDGETLLIEWSSRGSKFKVGEVERKYASWGKRPLTGRPVTIASVVRLAKAGGWSGKLNDSFTQEREARATRRGKGDNGGGKFSQMDAAERFRDENKDRFKHSANAGGWHTWNGAHWERGDDIGPTNAMMELIRRVNDDEKAGNHEKNGDSRFIFGALKLAAKLPGIAVTEKAFDADPFLLATPGGTVDLRTGELREARPDDLLTRCTTATPSERADCPLWREFLAFAMRGDPEMVRFLQQWAGYGLSGDVREHCFAFFFGSGGNGKGTFLNAVLAIMGSYGQQINAATLMAGASERHLTELASLRGARFIVAPEVTAGKAWDEERVQSMTGGDMMRARFMRQDEFQFMPEFKITISGNNQPLLKNVNDAMKRRLRIVPFTRKPEKVDKDLPEKLRAEYPAILRWAIEGYLDWQENGLIVPAAVGTATASYFSRQDVFGEWVAEHCEISPERPDWFTTTEDLLLSYNGFRAENGESRTTARLIGDPLTHAGAMPTAGRDKEGKRRNGWRFIRLIVDPNAGFPGN